MVTTQLTLFEDSPKVQKAIERFRAFEPEDGYYLAFSGGKDSMCIYHLAKMAGVKFTPYYNVTGIDPPELIYFIREHYPDVIFSRPKTTMWALIVKKRMPPTRLIRYCCDHLKERTGLGRFVVTGVRWAESAKRKNTRAMLELNFNSKTKNIRLNNDNDEARRMVESCIKKNKHILNPIIDWTDEDVWHFIHAHKLPYCCLYDEGFKRIGCIGCPMGGSKNMEREFARYPRFKALYLKAFADMIAARRERGLVDRLFTSPEAVMEWWLYGNKKSKEVEGQTIIHEERGR